MKQAGTANSSVTEGLAQAAPAENKGLATGTYIELNQGIKTKSGNIIAKGTQGVVSGPGDVDGAIEVEFQISDGTLEYMTRMDIRSSWLSVLTFSVGMTVILRKSMETGTRG